MSDPDHPLWALWVLVGRRAWRRWKARKRGRHERDHPQEDPPPPP